MHNFITTLEISNHVQYITFCGWCIPGFLKLLLSTKLTCTLMFVLMCTHACMCMCSLPWLVITTKAKQCSCKEVAAKN